MGGRVGIVLENFVSRHVRERLSIAQHKKAVRSTLEVEQLPDFDSLSLHLLEILLIGETTGGVLGAYLIDTSEAEPPIGGLQSRYPLPQFLILGLQILHSLLIFLSAFLCIDTIPFHSLLLFSDEPRIWWRCKGFQEGWITTLSKKGMDGWYLFIARSHLLILGLAPSLAPYFHIECFKSRVI